MIDIGKLKFDQNGLIPAIVTETGTGKVLMIAYIILFGVLGSDQFIYFQF